MTILAGLPSKAATRAVSRPTSRPDRRSPAGACSGGAPAAEAGACAATTRPAARPIRAHDTPAEKASGCPPGACRTWRDEIDPRFTRSWPPVRQRQRFPRAEDRQVAPGAKLAVPEAAVQRVGAILDQRDAATVAEVTYLRHRAGESEVVDQHHGSCPHADARLNAIDIDLKVPADREEDGRAPTASTGVTTDSQR